MAVDGRLVAGGLDAAAKGRLRIAGSRGPTADLELKVASANLRIATRRPARRRKRFRPQLSARLALAEGTVSLSDLAGKVAGTDISGRLNIGFADPVSIGGELSLGALNLPAAIAAAIGAAAGGRAAAGRAEPFERGLIGAVEGSVKLRIGRVALSPQLGVANMRGVLQFGHDSFALEEIDGSIAGGRVAGSIDASSAATTGSASTRTSGSPAPISPTCCPATAR